MAQMTFTEDDEGKTVVDGTGETIGIVSGVRGDTAYVDPDPGATDRVKTMLGEEDIEEGDYPIDASMIEHVNDDEIRLQRGT